MSSFTNWATESIKHAQGVLGESSVREWLVRKKLQHAQVDLIVKRDDKWILMEVKNQERFTAPPFDGHGLPLWQFETRLQFFQDTNVEPWLFVVEPNCLDIAYCASMVSLNDLPDEKKLITGKTKRIIFPLSEFSEIKLK